MARSGSLLDMSSGAKGRLRLNGSVHYAIVQGLDGCKQGL